MGRGRSLALALTVALALALAATACSAAPAAAPGTTAGPALDVVVRAGGPSAPGDPKVAIVAGAAGLVGTPFEVVDAAGTVVASGGLRPANGRHEPFAAAYSADVSSVRSPGEYTVVVGGARSTPWVVAEDPYEGLVPLLLEVLAVNHDGDEPSPAHGPSHLHDATIAVGPHAGEHVDLTGGWMDSGDQIKFTLTTAFTVLALEWSARLDAEDADALRTEAQVGLRWLLKAHPAPDLFVRQVDDRTDHDADARNPDEDDASPDPHRNDRAAYPTVRSDVAGKAAAALAIGGEIDAAVDWYALGAATRDAAAELDEEPSGFYEDSEPGFWTDDMALAAAELWRATGDPGYLDDAAGWFAELPEELQYAGTDVFTTGVFAAAELCGALGGAPAPPGPARQAAAAFLASSAGADLDRVGPGQTDENPWGNLAEAPTPMVLRTLGHAATLALARRCDLLDAGDARVAEVAARDFVFGRNPWGVDFVVGHSDRSATTTHHWLTLTTGEAVAGGVQLGPTDPADFEPGDGQGGPSAGPFDSRYWVYADDPLRYLNTEVGVPSNAEAILAFVLLSAPDE